MSTLVKLRMDMVDRMDKMDEEQPYAWFCFCTLLLQATHIGIECSPHWWELRMFYLVAFLSCSCLVAVLALAHNQNRILYFGIASSMGHADSLPPAISIEEHQIDSAYGPLLLDPKGPSACPARAGHA